MWDRSGSKVSSCGGFFFRFFFCFLLALQNPAPVKLVPFAVTSYCAANVALLVAVAFFLHFPSARADLARAKEVHNGVAGWEEDGGGKNPTTPAAICDIGFGHSRTVKLPT